MVSEPSVIEAAIPAKSVASSRVSPTEKAHVPLNQPVVSTVTVASRPFAATVPSPIDGFVVVLTDHNCSCWGLRRFCCPWLLAKKIVGVLRSQGCPRR